ncbi:ABC-2 family transporter protein-domain-containing protein [Thamnocephalis sphaerospora]|uniref:ABC-2 family transporter protein-domain-containing protein n=1 Tax=Thamnocephalis sphaerospora TaxID=78915 RepID=A0A4P9XH78_9FUNG|nr:ABC-2 family transporter protein-domain-containing protein [Thamnocephalis sphaerospora]|eukprot:RKP05002.1 ABC-2 family transporter protein-domain-containing protein [Thamnocephalis sphaerospora]
MRSGAQLYCVYLTQPQTQPSRTSADYESSSTDNGVLLQRIPWSGTEAADHASELREKMPANDTTTSTSYGASRWRQLGIMLRRNATLQWRYRKSTFAQILFAPVLLMLLLFLLQKIDHSRQRNVLYHPTTYDLNGVPTCQGRTAKTPCVNLLYTPNDETTQRILTLFAEKNAQRTGEAPFTLESAPLVPDSTPQHTLGMVPVDSAAVIYNYTLAHPNVTAFGIEFTSTPGDQPSYRYQIWYNNSLHGNGTDQYGTPILSLMRGLDEAIVASVGADSVASTLIDVSLKDWPTVPPDVVSDRIVAMSGAMFSFCTEMVIFIAVLNTIVSEKEQKLRESMAMMGLNAEIYWLSWFLINFVIVLLCAVVTSLLGLAFQFEVFKHTNFAVLVITFLLFGMAMISFIARDDACYVACTVFLDLYMPIVLICGIFLFIIGLLFESFVFSNAFVGYIWWAETTSPAGWIVLMFVPFFNFGKIYLDMTQYTTGQLNSLARTYIPGPGFSWAKLNEHLPSNLLAGTLSSTPERVPKPVQSWYLLLMNIAVFYLLTWYFDKIIPNEFGQRRKPWFFLAPSYWGLRRRASSDISGWMAGQSDEKIEV